MEEVMVRDDDGYMVSRIVSKLPSKDACRPLRRRVQGNSPPPQLQLADVPVMLVVQPKGLRSGYSHLTVVTTDPNNKPFMLNPPVHREYQRFAEHASPADAASRSEGGDFVTFFQHTVPMLDLSVVASDGRLLLARSPTGSFYVCFPAANRWVALPPAPAVVSDRDAAIAFHCNVDVDAGAISYKVVLLASDVVATFSSRNAEWKAEAALGAPDAALAASPGIHAGNCTYWLSAPDHACVICFDGTRGGVSVLDEPPLAEGFTKRVGRSLGSAGGQLRLCAFDIRDNEPGNVQPHAIDGLHGVWVLDGAGTWERVHEAVVDDISTSFFHVPHGPELPVLDFAGASGSAIIINKNQTLLRRDLNSGEKVKLLDLCKQQYGKLYRHVDVFPLLE